MTTIGWVIIIVLAIYSWETRQRLIKVAKLVDEKFMYLENRVSYLENELSNSSSQFIDDDIIL